MTEPRVEAGDRALERTPQDYAIEFGEYLAKAAEQFMEQSNLYDKAEAAGTDPDYDALSDCWRGLQSAIGEFRKRAKRAAESAMNAQERELARALNNLKCEVVGWLGLARPMLIQELSFTNVRVMEHHVVEAERLLSERGEGR